MLGDYILRATDDGGLSDAVSRAGDFDVDGLAAGEDRIEFVYENGDVCVAEDATVLSTFFRPKMPARDSSRIQMVENAPSTN